METQLQQSDYANTNSPESITKLDGSQQGSLAALPPATTFNSQWSEIQAKTSVFFERLPENVNTFFNTYKKPITVIAAFFAAIVTVRVLLAVLYAINSIPLVSPLLEMVGIGYTTWFIFRYLLKAENRQELATDFQQFKKEILGDKMVDQA